MASSSRALCVLLFTLAVCQAGAARPTPAVTGPTSLAQTIVKIFQDLGSLSDNLRSTAEAITPYNAGWRGYKISGAFDVITERVVKAISLLEDLSSNDEDKTTLSEDDAKLVVKALEGFVVVHTLALDAVISKHGLVTLVPYVEGIRQALLNLEDNINGFFDDVDVRIPTQARAANEQFGILGVKLHEAIATYEEPLLNAASTLFANH